LSFVYFTDRDLGTRFPDILQDAGLTVERHADHFIHNAPDAEWLAEISRRGWIALTHNLRIRYIPNELQAVIDHRASLLVMVGQAPFPELALTFVVMLPRIERFLKQHDPPFIAKVYRPSPAEIARRATARGRIELWYPQGR
jgi:hypothetical protein